MEGILEFFMANRGTIYMVILSVFLGIEVISHVPAILHTPLMSGANAIHGVVIIGAIIVMGHADTTGAMILGFLAVVLGTLNVVGGFVVTDRMLEMFKKKNRYDIDPDPDKRWHNERRITFFCRNLRSRDLIYTGFGIIHPWPEDAQSSTVGTQGKPYRCGRYGTGHSSHPLVSPEGR